MKKLLFAFVALLTLVTLTGCGKNYGKEFKEEYEALNGKILKGDIKYRDLNINENNPYEKVSIDKIAEMINNKETFYLYVGDPMCPWCRSGLEKMIEVANKEGIDKIYYVDFWDDNHNEILRDLYDLVSEKVEELEKTNIDITDYKVVQGLLRDVAIRSRFYDI